MEVDVEEEERGGGGMGTTTIKLVLLVHFPLGAMALHASQAPISNAAPLLLLFPSILRS